MVGTAPSLSHLYYYSYPPTILQASSYSANLTATVTYGATYSPSVDFLHSFNSEAMNGYNQVQQPTQWPDTTFNALGKHKFDPMQDTMQILTSTQDGPPQHSLVRFVQMGYCNQNIEQNAYTIQPDHIQPNQLLQTSTWELQPTIIAPAAHIPQQPVLNGLPPPLCSDTPPPPSVKNKPSRKRDSKKTSSKKTRHMIAGPDFPLNTKKKPRGRPRSQPPVKDTLNVQTVRQTHLENNRLAAHKCRQRKKEFVQGLESRASEASVRNRNMKLMVANLREEVLELKNEVLNHVTCGFWGIDRYLAQQMESSVLKTEANTPSADDPMFYLNFDYMEDDDMRWSGENCD